MNGSQQRALYRPAPAVAVEREPESATSPAARVYLASLPDGPLLYLDGTAAVIWTEAVTAAESSVAVRVADLVGLAAAEVEPDVERFLAELVERGLLVELAGDDSAGSPWAD